MEQKKRIPIGIGDFREIREKGYYYVDKTGMIRDMLQDRVKVTLIARPHRFGKSLNMSMLYHFFSMDGDKSIFDGLEISKEKELCEKHMGKYPVIFLSLKDVEGENYEEAFRAMVHLINEVAKSVGYLSDSSNLNEHYKKRYRALLNNEMSDTTLINSLHLLTSLLEKHHGEQVVVLIDEYDVTMESAFQNGYYDKMAYLIQRMFGAALKTNGSLEFAVLTGHFLVTRGSIYSGLNNMYLVPITHYQFDEYFGFQDDEVRDLLAYYGLSDRHGEVRDWHGGYRIGGEKLYCPWGVLNRCAELLGDPNAKPDDDRIDTRGSNEVRSFIEKANATMWDEIERLVAGETIVEEIYEYLTHSEIYDSTKNLWSLLFMTGYLTSLGRTDEGLLKLKIPNLEVRDVFVKQIREYFKKSVKSDTDTLDAFCTALVRGDADEVERIFAQYLEEAIRIRSTIDFYQGVITGVLAVKEGWDVKSNRESGDGYADILIIPEHGDLGVGIVIELKYDKDLEKGCRDALDQIEEKRYAEELQYEGMETILKYGVSCYKKTCRVVLRE